MIEYIYININSLFKNGFTSSPYMSIIQDLPSYYSDPEASINSCIEHTYILWLSTKACYSLTLKWLLGKQFQQTGARWWGELSTSQSKLEAIRQSHIFPVHSL